MVTPTEASEVVGALGEVVAVVAGKADCEEGALVLVGFGFLLLIGATMSKAAATCRQK